MRYISFAQEFEDIILYSALGQYVDRGIYVDIGANDPCRISVTKFFYDLGWRGINIEPLEDEYNLLCRERPEDENINIGVSNVDGELELAIGGVGSSFRYAEISGKKMLKPIRRFIKIFEQSRFFGQEVHFCKIDVEGFEKNALEGMDFTCFKPWIFVIESVLPATHKPCYEEWEYILLEQGYICGLSHGVNRYYIRKDKLFLKEGLCNFYKIFLNNSIVKVSYEGMWDDIRFKLAQAEKIVLFGAGEYMRNYMKIYGEKYKPDIIVDNSEEKWGENIYDIKVQKPDILKEIVDDQTLILICCANADDIERQLLGMRINQYVKYCPV